MAVYAVGDSERNQRWCSDSSYVWEGWCFGCVDRVAGVAYCGQRSVRDLESPPAATGERRAEVMRRLKQWLLLSREQINAVELEGVRNARNLSEVTAAMAWAEIHRRHPWRGFFMDILGGVAMVGAAIIRAPMRGGA